MNTVSISGNNLDVSIECNAIQLNTIMEIMNTTGIKSISIVKRDIEEEVDDIIQELEDLEEEEDKEERRKEARRVKAKQKVECEKCGRSVTRGNMTNHKRSKVCKNYKP